MSKEWASLLHNARENGNPSDVSAPLNIPDAQNRVSTNSVHNCHPHSTIGSKPRSEATQAHWYVLRTTYGREQKAFDYMHDTWRSQGAEERLETEIWDIPHSCPLKAQQRVLEFFKKML